MQSSHVSLATRSLGLSGILVAGLLFGTSAVRAEDPSARLSGATAFSASLPDPSDAAALARFVRWRPGVAPLVSAHRGGPSPGYPENCIPTFERALQYGPTIVEVDVRRTVDGRMVLLHDWELDRTTTGTGLLEESTFAHVRGLKLVDNDGRVTPYQMPTLGEALDWARGKTLLELDIKRNVVPEELVAALREHRALGAVLVIVYDMETARKYHALEPSLVFAVPGPNEQAVEALVASPVPTDQMIAFVGLEHPSAATYEALHGLGIRAILGTIGLLDVEAHHHGLLTYGDHIRRGADVLATDDAARASLALWHLRLDLNP